LSQSVKKKVLGRLAPYDYAKALHTLAMTLSWAGKNDEALTLADGAVTLVPDDAEFLAQYGRLLEKAGRSDEAVTVLEKAVANDPRNSMVLAHLADQYGRRQGRYADARDLLLRAIDCTPHSAPLSFRVELQRKLELCNGILEDDEAARQRRGTTLAVHPDRKAPPQERDGAAP
jgi:tetratricopeptide (TPR) repeat protein